MKEFSLGLMVGFIQTTIGHPLDTLKTNYQNRTTINMNGNKIKILYRGVKYPLMSSVITNGFLFHSNDLFHNKFNNYYLSGFLTGVICSPFINGFEAIKVKKQINNDNKINKIKLINLGLSATLARESIACSLYFGTFNALRKNNDAFTSGSIAGIMSWLFTYPFDVIKTRIQSGDSSTWKNAISKGGLFKGLTICLIRSFIVNGSSFMAYDYIKKLY